MQAKDFEPWQSFLDVPHLSRSVGDAEAAYAQSEHKIESTLRMGGQEHFYFETNAAIAAPVDNGKSVEIIASCQNLTLAQKSAAHALGLKMNNISAKARRLGGGFGGKESRFHVFTSAVAVAAVKFNRPVRCMMDRAGYEIARAHSLN